MAPAATITRGARIVRRPTTVSRDGSSVQYGSTVEDSLHDIEPYVANFAVSMALIQRQEEPLHATVVGFNERAIGFLGPSGAGKSTLAAFLLSQGARLITDDMLRITIEKDVAWAHPGPLRLKLRKEVAARYCGDVASCGRWNPLADKFLFEPSNPEFRHHPVPLAALFWLSGQPEELGARNVGLERLSGRELFKILSASTMNSRVLNPERLRRQFEFAVRIGRILPVYTLAYRRDYDLLCQVAESLQPFSR